MDQHRIEFTICKRHFSNGQQSNNRGDKEYKIFVAEEEARVERDEKRILSENLENFEKAGDRLRSEISHPALRYMLIHLEDLLLNS